MHYIYCVGGFVFVELERRRGCSILILYLLNTCMLCLSRLLPSHVCLSVGKSMQRRNRSFTIEEQQVQKKGTGQSSFSVTCLNAPEKPYDRFLMSCLFL